MYTARHCDVIGASPLFTEYSTDIDKEHDMISFIFKGHWVPNS